MYQMRNGWTVDSTVTLARNENNHDNDEPNNKTNKKRNNKKK